MVYGASSDPIGALHQFQRKYNLSMPLLSDKHGLLRELLGNPDGAEPAARITYVIDTSGVVRSVIGVPRIGADEHPQAALESIRGL